MCIEDDDMRDEIEKKKNISNKVETCKWKKGLQKRDREKKIDGNRVCGE